MIEYLFSYLTVFTLRQELPTEPIPRTFDVNLYATKPRTLVEGDEYF